MQIYYKTLLYHEIKSARNFWTWQKHLQHNKIFTEFYASQNLVLHRMHLFTYM